MGAARLTAEEKSEEAELVAQAWANYDLTYLLKPHQMRLYGEMLEELEAETSYMMMCSRRWGKSFMLCVFAVMHCISTPDAQCMYAAPTGKQVRKIIMPHLRAIFRDAPEDMKPHWSTADGCFVFPNGATLSVAGCDKGNAESLRGAYTTLGILDECGFIDDFRYVYKDIIVPQTGTCDGKVILISTPPRSPAHEFGEMFMEAEALGAGGHRTIWDALEENGGHLSDRAVQNYLAESDPAFKRLRRKNPEAAREQYLAWKAERSGPEGSTWQREYMARLVVDQEYAVVPEWAVFSDMCTGEPEPAPEYYNAFTMVDFGFADLTAALLCYWWYEQNKLVVVAEGTWRRQSSAVIIPELMELEREMWSERSIPDGSDTWWPQARYCDASAMQRADLAAVHGTPFTQTQKHEREAHVNALRTAISDGRVLIHPRCKMLLACLSTAVWNRSRTDLDRSATLGHYDHLIALVYAYRSANRASDPRPVWYNGETAATHWLEDRNRQRQSNRIQDQVQEAFGRRRRR